MKVESHLYTCVYAANDRKKKCVADAALPQQINVNEKIIRCRVGGGQKNGARWLHFLREFRQDYCRNL